MNELELALIGSSAAAPPDHILEGLTDELALRQVPGAPHTVYSELWHLAFWQRMTLDWIENKETPIPTHASFGFPTQADTDAEPWPALCERFLSEAHQAAAFAREPDGLNRLIRCPSPPGKPTRVMSVREQLESLAAHNAYHFGRIVLLRQLLHAWPPASGGFTW